MRTRAAIVSMLVMGFTFSTTGAGLAITGFAESKQAADAQYPPPPAPPQTVTTTPPAPAPQQGVLPETEQSPPVAEEEVIPDAKPEQNAKPDEAVAPAQEVQPTRQAEVGADTGDSLPFTGFAALPVLLFGIALMTAGLVMRRSARQG